MIALIINKFLQLSLTLGILYLSTSCSTSDEPSYKTLPEEAKLKILAIGNSFTLNSTLYLPQILADTHNNDDILVCQIKKSGASLQDHCSNLMSDAVEYQLSWTTGAEWHKQGKTNIRSALNIADWDIVIIQQVSGLSGIPTSYHPYLSNLVSKIERLCPSAGIGWQMTWSYSRNSTHPDFKNYDYNSEKMLQNIRISLKEVQPYVSVIIPSGEMIELLRQSEFNTTKDLTTDGFHLEEGLPCFALSCLWHEILITPITGKTCINSSLTTSGHVNVSIEAKLFIKSTLNELLSASFINRV